MLEDITRHNISIHKDRGSSEKRKTLQLALLGSDAILESLVGGDTLPIDFVGLIISKFDVYCAFFNLKVQKASVWANVCSPLQQVEMNISESLSSMFLMLMESLYKPDVVVRQNVENLLILMRLAHIYDADSTLKTCQRYRW